VNTASSTPLPESFARLRVVVLGLAREGTALARYLCRHGARVTVSDTKGREQLADQLASLRGLDVRESLGGHRPELLDADIVFVSPGIPPTIPFLAEARRRGIRLSSSTEIVLTRSAAPVIGITGSSGKSTTTSLVGEILRASGCRTWVGGNIGRPLVGELDEIAPGDRVALELSSFQLEGLPVSPPIACVLNLAPDHLDRHRTMDAYREAKLSILRCQSPADVAVLNLDDAGVVGMAAATPGQRRWFSLSQEPAADGAFLRLDRLVIRAGGSEGAICRRHEVRLRGAHNVANLLAACVAAEAAGGTIEAMRQVALSFAGVAHRLQVVGQKRGHTFVDDSIATSPTRSLAALAAFEPPIVLLAGGRHKNLPLSDWARTVCERVEQIVLFGEAADVLGAAIEDACRDLGAGAQGLLVHRVSSLEAALALAVNVAPESSVVLLSPACTSFDTFRDYGERGDRFAQLVSEIKES
jgi:UDP-N-acetylmuramoylalanine--D-glutamate ligase